MKRHIPYTTLMKIEELEIQKRFRKEKTTCEWIWGPSGTGKTHYAYEKLKDMDYYSWSLYDKGWQDGYTQQDVVLIDNFEGEIPFGEILKLIDRWPYSLSRRHKAPIPFISKHIIITSLKPPCEIYPETLNGKEDVNALLKRIETIIHLKESSNEKIYEGK